MTLAQSGLNCWLGIGKYRLSSFSTQTRSHENDEYALEKESAFLSYGFCLVCQTRLLPLTAFVEFLEQRRRVFEQLYGVAKLDNADCIEDEDLVKSQNRFQLVGDGDDGPVLEPSVHELIYYPAVGLVHASVI